MNEKLKAIFVGQSGIPVILAEETLLIFSPDRPIQKIVLIESTQVQDGESLYELVLRELASTFGTPPIYGPEERELMIFDRRNGGDLTGNRVDSTWSGGRDEILRLLQAETHGSIREGS